MKNLAVILGALLVLGSGVSAHHAHTDFALDRNATVDGTIQGILFQNPHVLIRLRTADSTLFTLEWRAAEWLAHHPELVTAGRGPVTSHTLKFGDRIVVVGAPARDQSLRTLVDLKEVRRPSDGWRWTLTAATY